MEPFILNNIDTIMEISSYIKSFSTLKEYVQKLDEFVWFEGKIIDKYIGKTYRKMDYFYQEDLIDYVQSKKDLCRNDDLISWLKKFGHNNTINIPIIFSYKSKQSGIKIFNIKKFIGELSCKFPEVKFQIYVKWYYENILFSNGFLEKRNLNHMILKVFYNNKIIFSKVYCNFVELINDQKKISSIICLKTDEFKKQIEIKVENINNFEEICCLFIPETAVMVFHEAIGHMVERDVYENVLLNDLEYRKKISTNKLQIWDIPKNQCIKTNILFDDTGTVAKEIQVVRDGVLYGVMSDEQIDIKGYQKKGFIRTSMDKEEQQIRMRNIFVENGLDNIEKIRNQKKKLLIVTKISNSYRNKKTVFFEVEEATLIEKDKADIKIEKFLLYNNTKKLLNSIEHICNDGRWYELHCCRKNDATIYLSTFSPSITCKCRYQSQIRPMINNKKKEDLL